MDHQLTPPLRPNPQSGAALIVTLTLLLLITGLAISLFMTANTELQSASQFKNSQGLTELSDICVNLVMGQIKDATTTNAAGTPANRSTWASQPGMIRTYGSSTNAAMSYKLYSWSDPRVSGDDTASVPATWFSTPAIYTDLNAPIPSSTAPSDANFYRYPIAYPPPPSTDPTRPMGYDVLGAPVGSVSGETIVNSVPMPVQWLYVLKDGTMVYPTSASGSNATISGASAANPIVARVAYWTDDETSKVNINTAAGGPFWMTPVYASVDMVNPPGTVNARGELSVWSSTGGYLAQYQPMQFEFQRYPGHPARTDLRALFPDLTMTDPSTSSNSIYSFAPRVQFGGSMRAMKAGANSAANTVAVAMDADRIFATTGEARYAASGNGTRTDFQATGTWPDRIEKNKFLVTATSRAPEITLYGTPRISIWPEPATATPAARTPYDALIALCSSLPGSSGRDNYFFDRADPLSPTSDIGRSRNSQLLGYLNNMMTVPSIPGTSSTGFAAKGDANDLAQIQTQFFDYIRCINLTDTHPSTGNNISYTKASIVVPSERGSTRGFGRFYTLNQFGLIFAATADAATPSSNVPENKSLQSAPGTPNATLLTPNQTRVMALPVIELMNLAAGCGAPRPSLSGNISLRIRGLDGLRVNTATLGFANSYDIGNLPDNGYYNDSANNLEIQNGGLLTHATPLRTMNGFNDLAPVNGFNATTSGYPVSQAFTVPTGSSMTVASSNPIYVDIITTSSTNTITIPAFSSSVTAPELVTSSISKNATSPATYAQPGAMVWSFHSEGIGIAGSTGTLPIGANSTVIKGRTGYKFNNAPSCGLIYTSDAVLSLATKTSDARLVMANPGNGTANFDVVPALVGNARMRHRFFSRWATADTTTFCPGANYEPLALGIMNSSTSSGRFTMLPKLADWPSGVPHPNDWSDFDNGYTQVADGAYIGKPDEGELEGTGGVTGLVGDGQMGVNGPYFGASRGNSIQVTTGGAGGLGSSGALAGSGATVWSSPNREIASPVAFGLLPSGALKGRAWQNLLFRPAPTSPAGSLNPGRLHPGAAGMMWDGSSASSAPPDHYLLDYFWMPVVEPWAISETFSTAGKINMNYQIAPFSYIKRQTAMHALLNTEVIPAVPSIVSASDPKGAWQSGYSKAVLTLNQLRPLNSLVIEREVNIPETLKAFDQRLSAGRLFASATEICDLSLVPKGVNNSTNSVNDPTFAAINTFWSNNRMTSDKLRELPYNNIYPRLTTKSNTYTVHYSVQMLKKLPGGDQSTWDESKDKVASELRGSTLIERFLDPNATYPDYATAFSTSASLETLYRFRVLQRSQFTP
jgi:uncharacterized protein (TIGR02600 family)